MQTSCIVISYLAADEKPVQEANGYNVEKYYTVSLIPNKQKITLRIIIQ